MMKAVALAVVATAMMCLSVQAEDAKLGKDDFISSAVSDIFDKVGKYTSGEKDIFITKDDEKEPEKDYDTDALGRKIPATPVKSGSGPMTEKI